MNGDNSMISKKSQGVISIFLIVILLPMLTLGVVLIDGARMRSAKVIAQEASDIAALSVLSDYNTLLKDEFGLFALNDASSVSSKFESYLKASLNAYGGTDVDSYSDMVRILMQKSILDTGNYVDMDFLNLYNFDVSSTEIEMLYTLNDMAVLESQIAEYTKFRGIIPIMRRLSVLSQAGQVKDDIEKSINAMNVMNEKIAIDENDGANAEKAVGELMKPLDKYNGTEDIDGLISKLNSKENGYYSALSAYLDELEDGGESSDKSKNDYKNAADELIAQLDELDATYEDIKTSCVDLISKLNLAIPKYTALRDKYNDTKIYGSDSTETAVSNDCTKTINIYGELLAGANELLSDLNTVRVSDIIASIKQNIDTIDQNIVSSIANHKDAVSEQSSEKAVSDSESDDESEATPKEIIFEYIKTDGANSSNKKEVYTDYHDKIHNEIIKLKDNYAFNNPLKISNKEDFNEGMATIIGNMANDKKREKKDEASKVTLSDEEYNALPSQAQNRNTYTYTYDEMKLDKENGTDTVNSVSGSLRSFMTNFLASSTNDLLVYSYILGTFKTRMSGNNEIEYNKPPDPLEKWHTKWRYGDKPISDLRGNPLDDRKTRFKNAEVEYIFAGHKSEAANEATVYAWIYATRMANNLIAVYTDKDGANSECYIAASATAAALGFVVPISVFHWIYMIAWAAGETYLEMIMLIDKGFSVPLIKTKNNLYIEHIWSIAELMGGGVDNLAKNSGDKEVLLAYEDYLVIMLAFVGAETRLARTADLIQLNMGKLGQSGFRMDDAYTYFRSSSNIGIKYLFSNTSQFTWGYSGTGLRFNNTLYKGY